MTDDSIGMELLGVVVRLNRWVTHLTIWGQEVTLAQVRVLSQIDERGHVRISELARAERCSQPTMTVQVRRLREQGLVDTAPDPDDARAVRVSLTDRGVQALADTRRARKEIIDSLISRLDAADRKRLPDAMRVLSSLLQAAQDELPISNDPRRKEPQTP